MSYGDLVTLSKADRARLASHYQSVCDSGRKFQLGDGYRPEPVCEPGAPLAWAARNGPPIDSN
jgi:hypothetical protein